MIFEQFGKLFVYKHSCNLKGKVDTVELSFKKKIVICGLCQGMQFMTGFKVRAWKYYPV